MYDCIIQESQVSQKEHWFVPALFSLCTLMLQLFCFGCSAPQSAQGIWYVRHSIETRGGELVRQDQLILLNPVTLDRKILFTDAPTEYIDFAGLAPDGQNVAFVLTDTDHRKAVWLALIGSVPTKVSPDFVKTDFVWLNSTQLIWMGTNEEYERADQGAWGQYNILRKEGRPLGLQEPIPIYCRRHRSGFASNRLVLQGDQSTSFGHLVLDGDIIKWSTDIQLDPLETPVGTGDTCKSDMSDQESVVFARASSVTNLEVFLLQRKNGQSRPLTNFFQEFSFSTVDDLALSPDNEWVIFNAALQQKGQPVRARQEAIVLADLLQQTVRILGSWNSSEPSGLIWSPDSKKVVLVSSSMDSVTNQILSQISILEIKGNGTKDLIKENGSIQIFDWR